MPYCLILTFATDKPKAFERDSIYNIDTILICCTGKKVFGHLFTFTITYSFDIHICSTRTGSFYVLCINRLK